MFASPRSKRLDLHNFRAREWAPTLDAAGIPRRRIYDLRQTFVTHALAAGLGLFELSRYMGTSVKLLDKTTATSPKAPKTEPANSSKATPRTVLAKS